MMLRPSPAALSLPPPPPPPQAPNPRASVRRRRCDGGDADIVAANTLLSERCRSNDLAGAGRIFDEMGERRDLVSWTAMASGLARGGRRREALSLLVEMLRDAELSPNGFTLSVAINACSAPETFESALPVLGVAVKLGLCGSDAAVGCALIDMFAKNGDLHSARKVFDGMLETNVIAWTAMITRYVHSGHAQMALEFFLDMLATGIQPDEFTLTSVTSSCTELRHVGLGRQLHSYGIRTGLVSDVCVGCALIDMYTKLPIPGSVENARMLFDGMPEHNVMSCTAIISACAEEGKNGDAIELFTNMVSGAVAPNHLTYAGVLKACQNLSSGRLGVQVHARIVKSGLQSVIVVGSALVGMYAQAARMDAARQVFMLACSGHGDHAEFGASAFTYACLLSSAAAVGMMAKGQQLHALAVKKGLSSETLVGNSLVSMYSRCGDVGDAHLAFDETECRNVVSWTSLITGYAKHGEGDKALELFREMVGSGISPNGVTYIAALTACSHAGLVDEARRHFETMVSDRRLVPRMDHFACMVDLLGRSGRLREALGFIAAMPVEADAVVWKVFLSACRIHGDVDLGELASERILRLDPQDPAAYILLSNLYADAGRWDDAADLRREMKRRGLNKEAGRSWVEVGSRIHEFHAGDARHPQAREIYAELERLIGEIKAMGYAPETAVVLHDMDEDMKERSLAQHSEKLAVVFGLISTAPPKPVRVFKNLRVCRDCHSALQFMSSAAGREIVVRDAGRFHWMKDGRCSCGGYW